MKRVCIVGISGAGKSTLARELAGRLEARHVELDGIFHQPDWTPLPTEAFRERVAEIVALERWVIDGNYLTKTQDLVWSEADTLVWLDLPRRTILPRLVSRTLRRIWTREELWNGNREHWTNLVDPRPERNILLWLCTQHRRHRRRIAADLAETRWAHLDVHRLRSSAEVAAFLERERSGAGIVDFSS